MGNSMRLVVWALCALVSFSALAECQTPTAAQPVCASALDDKTDIVRWAVPPEADCIFIAAADPGGELTETIVSARLLSGAMRSSYTSPAKPGGASVYAVLWQSLVDPGDAEPYCPEPYRVIGALNGDTLKRP